MFGYFSLNVKVGRFCTFCTGRLSVKSTQPITLMFYTVQQFQQKIYFHNIVFKLFFDLVKSAHEEIQTFGVFS